MSSGNQQDDYGYWGPSYDFASNIPLPGQIGVRQEASVDAILDSVAGVNFYSDVIGFGSPTFFDQQNVQPMGLRYFLNTGMRCSNGATMSQYNDGVTKGNLLGSDVAAALTSAGLPGLRGLAPGMVENARDALDPRPIFAAVTGTGYPVCQQVQCPVGDINGRIQNANNSSQPYIVDPVQYVNGVPTQTRWVQAYDATGSPINVTKDEFGASSKCYNADGTYNTNVPNGCPSVEPAAGATAGSDPYELCTVLRPAVMPPSLSGSGSGSDEGFQTLAAGDGASAVGIAIGVAILGGIGLWAMARRR
jgi:hypothetical protein